MNQEEREIRMHRPGGRIQERVKSARLQARELVDDDIREGLASSSSAEELEELVDEKVGYILEAESLMDSQSAVDLLQDDTAEESEVMAA